ncbi:asparagine synthase (glutamine-hydrolyzing) [Mucilaginibacter sabulilitoris]|uniref:asparagine synthase (glutamine-hydrolyzing) n=1 Tax=Mucilaginibacter sabulilitoris TaxID=1173583 RepID=A0ABZ0TEL4_9SPHI|nr:asparagine synthase (glutamine-hydrolyzing) [Mucilaginibacter sabulilitoris]WPU91631.1 asparagine synthase (glutamine-hydrolyzing) [Mucilaginibacter sabulilitoris]
MCRIAGIIDNRLQPEEIDLKVRAMCQVLQHGGPDDEGVFLDHSANLGFGHRRLSVIDLSSNGHQPMTDSAQKTCITFNGEIYNYQELKRDLLKRGAVFKSGTDTEVILSAYLHWGTAAFAKLRGMFAFALYDRNRRLTYLVRDTAGIKPLYYLACAGALSFASEVRAFSAAGITIEKDDNWPIRFLAYGHIPEPYTTLKDVFSLPKGHCLCWNNASSTYSITEYRKAPEKNQVSNIEEAQQIVRDALIKSISRQLIADASIGVFLSGGIDSSLITLLADQQNETELKIVSIFFNEKRYDEQSYQRLILNKLQGESFSHLVRQEDFEGSFPSIIDAMDMPTTDGINSWFISKYARKNGLKAVLSGIGADELFGGYPSFNRIRYMKYLRKIDPSVFSAITGLLPDRYKKLTFLASDHPLADQLLLRGLFPPGDIAQLLDIDTKHIRDTLFDSSPLPAMNLYNEEHASWLETNLYMQNQLLRDTDVMSMSQGLEVRVPFLDEDFTSAVAGIDPAIRFNAQQPKKLLIDSFNDLLPAEIWNRPKMGFTFPLQQWMMHHRDINNTEHYKGKTAKNIIKKFKNNKMHWSKIFALYQIQGHV